MKQNYKAYQFAQKMADFIYSKQGKETSQRILMRHFNKNQKELKSIWDILKLNNSIKIQSKAGYRKKTDLLLRYHEKQQRKI